MAGYKIEKQECPTTELAYNIVTIFLESFY